MSRFSLLLLVPLLLALLAAPAGGSPANPFDEEGLGRTLRPPESISGIPHTRATTWDALVAGANYLQAMQADITEDNAGNGSGGAESPNDPDDGGWDWVVTSPPHPFHHTTAASPTNIYGATAQGLYYAYLATGDPDYYTAMTDAANQLVAGGASTHRTASDMMFLMLYEDLPGTPGTTYSDAAKAKFDGRIAVYGSATALAEFIRDARYGQGYGNGIIAWDIGKYAKAAAMLEERYPADPYDYADAADDIAEVIFQDSYMDLPGYFDLIDDAGWDDTYANKNYWWYCLGVTGLMEAFQAANVHMDEMADLIDRIQDSMYPSGAVSGSYGANVHGGDPEYDADWQSTGYAALAFAAVDRTALQSDIDEMAGYMGTTQHSSGGWLYGDNTHYPEVAGECTAGIYFGLGIEIAPGPAPSCLSQANTCVTIPFDIERDDATAMRGYSVTFQLSSNLALCGLVVEGDYLSDIGGTHFEVTANGGGSYTVDCAILGNPCGADDPTGNLFDILVEKAGPDGTGTVSITQLLIRDCANVPIPCAAGAPLAITIDTVSPVAVSNLASAQVKAANDGDGTTKVTLTFTAPGDAAVVEVYRKGFGAYPEYDDAGGSVPGLPGSYPPAGWTLTSVVATGQTDEVAWPSRDYWYYVVYTKDSCGNISAVSNRAGGTLNYHLGDVSDGITNGQGDNVVGTPDISLLGANYGITLGPADPLGYLDVGPTTDYSVDGRPTTDNKVNFEDLMMFAINHGTVGFAGETPQLVSLGAAGRGAVRLLTGPVGAPLRAGQRFEVPILLRGEAAEVQGIWTVLRYDPTACEYLSARPADGLAQANHFFKDLPSEGAIDMNLALLGHDAAMQGEGTVMVATFRALRSGAPAFRLEQSHVRDIRNRELIGQPGLQAQRQARPGDLDAGGGAILEVRPNPFAGTTSISFELAEAAHLRISVYDVSGRLVRLLADEQAVSGRRAVVWDGTDGAGSRQASGIYFVRMEVAGRQIQQRLTLLR